MIDPILIAAALSLISQISKAVESHAKGETTAEQLAESLDEATAAHNGLQEAIKDRKAAGQ